MEIPFLIVSENTKDRPFLVRTSNAGDFTSGRLEKLVYPDCSTISKILNFR